MNRRLRVFDELREGLLQNSNNRAFLGEEMDAAIAAASQISAETVMILDK